MVLIWKKSTVASKWCGKWMCATISSLRMLFEGLLDGANSVASSICLKRQAWGTVALFNAKVLKVVTCRSERWSQTRAKESMRKRCQRWRRKRMSGGCLVSLHDHINNQALWLLRGVEDTAVVAKESRNFVIPLFARKDGLENNVFSVCSSKYTTTFTVTGSCDHALPQWRSNLSSFS